MFSSVLAVCGIPDGFMPVTEPVVWNFISFAVDSAVPQYITDFRMALKIPLHYCNSFTFSKPLVANNMTLCTPVIRFELKTACHLIF